MLKKNDLIDYFHKGIKNKNDLRIGVEHEKFVLKKESLHQLSYEESNGITDILLKFVNKGWKPKYDDKNTTIIALERFGESITLEPGGQIELSGAQLKNIHQTCQEIRESGGKITREPGPMKHGQTVIAFVEDPDGYKIELIDIQSRKNTN